MTRAGEPAGRPSAGSQLTPHDSLFKKIFGKPEHAASQLRAVLPRRLTGRLDLGRLAQVPGTFVDEALRQRHTDCLFSAPLDGQDAYVYILMEHQSKSDPLMPYRMLRYVTKIWDRYLEGNPRARKLSAVIPMVVYNGKGRWSAPLRLQDLIGPVPDADAEYLPRFSFLLDDLAVIGRDQLRDRDTTSTVRVTMVSLKDAPGNPLAHEVLWELFEDLRVMLCRPGGLEEFKALLAYIRDVGEAPDSELGRVADSLGPEAKDAYVTTAEMLEARGEVRGEARGQAKAILRNLKNCGIPVDDRSRDRIATCTDTETLDIWLDRSVKITEIAELFQD